MKLCLYGTNGSIFAGHYPGMLSRLRSDDGQPLISRVVVQTRSDSTPIRLREQYPHLEILALCDPGYVRCESDGMRYLGPDPGIDEPGRANSNPDMSVTIAVEQHVRAGLPDAYWRNADGTIAVAQAQDAVWHPIGRNLLYQGRMQNVLAVQAQECVRLCTGSPYDGIMADCHAGTLLSYGGKWQQMGLSLEAWREVWTGYCRALELMGVRLYENCYGPGGPRNSDGICAGYKLEGMLRQGGLRDDLPGWWGYLGMVEAHGYTSGLQLMTPEQAAQSMMTITPSASDDTPEEQYALLKSCLGIAVLFDVGYVCVHERWNNDPWDAHALWPNEIEQWTRLVPDSPTEWFRWSDRKQWMRTKDLPMAAECVAMGDLVGRRFVMDGSQQYRVWINPNPYDVGTLRACSVKLV